MSKGQIVCISGGFDPLGVHHLRYIEAAKKLGSVLVVILNSDDFLMVKKGYYVMTMRERTAILESIKWVDYVHQHIPTYPYDMTVSEALAKLKPDIFAKGGDRHPGADPIPEETICKKLGIEIVYGVGGYEKLSSSSWIMEEAFKRYELARR